MTSLELASELMQLRDIVRGFARTRIAAAAEQAEIERSIPPSIVRALDEIGLLAPLEPLNPLDPVPMVIVAEELGAGDPGIAFESICGAHAALAVATLGTAEQLEKVVALSSETSPLGSLWFYEGFGRGPDEYSTTFAGDGNGIRIDGDKRAVVRPGTAEFAVVIGRHDRKTAAALLLAEELSEYSVVRDDGRNRKLGLGAAHTGDVRLAGVRVGSDAILSGGDRFAVDRLVASARLATGAIAVGCATAAIEYASEYAAGRHAFGAPISSYQGVTFPLAESDMAIKGARAAILDQAYRLQHDISDSTTLATATTHAVAAATGAALQATTTAINTLGGHGYLADYPVERWYRAAGVLAAIDADPLPAF